MFAEGLALNPVGIDDGLACLGEANVELEELAIHFKRASRWVAVAPFALFARSHRDMQVMKATGAVWSSLQPHVVQREGPVFTGAAAIQPSLQRDPQAACNLLVAES